MSSVFVFNQYYVDLLKRLKSKCKENKDCEKAKSILALIKDNYTTLDKSSNEYIEFLNDQISVEKWEDFTKNDEWFTENSEIQIFKSISIEDISSVLEDKYLQLHFLSVFYIFKENLTEEISTQIVNVLQNLNVSTLNELEDENHKQIVKRLLDFRNANIKEKAGIDMNFIEDTTIGKLAKEIMQDIDVDKIQKKIGENGDILKAIGDPDSGLADVITNVSQKMANKISNGELKQENILQDALKFASTMPGMMGGGKGNKNTPDLSNMMQMMSSMMGDSNMQNMFKNMTGGPKKGQRTTVNEGALKKMAHMKKLKKKLREKQKNTEVSDS
jgi:hypothetical protein